MHKRAVIDDFIALFSYDWLKHPNDFEFVITRQNLFKLALVIAIITISYLVFSRPGYYSQSLPHLDKVGHLGSFFCLSCLTHLAFKPKWYLLAIMLASYAIFIELVQSQLSYRSASAADFVADMAGITLFYLVQWIFNKYFRVAKPLDTQAP